MRLGMDYAQEHVDKLNRRVVSHERCVVVYGLIWIMSAVASVVLLFFGYALAMVALAVAMLAAAECSWYVGWMRGREHRDVERVMADMAQRERERSGRVPRAKVALNESRRHLGLVPWNGDPDPDPELGSEPDFTDSKPNLTG